MVVGQTASVMAKSAPPASRKGSLLEASAQDRPASAHKPKVKKAAFQNDMVSKALADDFRFFQALGSTATLWRG